MQPGKTCTATFGGPTRTTWVMGQALELRVRSLQGEGRHVVVVGDFNISPKPIDHCEPRAEFCKRPGTGARSQAGTCNRYIEALAINAYLRLCNCAGRPAMVATATVLPRGSRTTA